MEQKMQNARISGEAGGDAAPSHSMQAHTHDHHDHTASAVDQVCGMSVDPATAGHKIDRDGRSFYFCSERCKMKFAENPAKYVGGKAKQPAHADAPEGTIYTCPMHPQIRQVGPGNCPICGMALEPELATADTGPNPELIDMTRRFWVGLALSIPVIILEMGGHLVGGHAWIDQSLSNWIQFALATPVVLWAGWPFFVRGWQSILTRNLNMFTLIAMGTGVAWVYSVVATMLPGVFPRPSAAMMARLPSTSRRQR
jgi:Cu+-exporting ATPase